MATKGKKVTAEFPEKLKCLFKPNRYKVLYGGRGGAKSWGIARALLIIGSNKQIRVLCARELQMSIKDSVHKLLSDQIENLGLSAFYEIQNASIKGKNGTEFSFAGLRSNVTQIKSYEGVDVAWIEEAQTVSKTSWNVLIPTIRKEGSEIWVSFNPELEEDETYQRFVLHPPAGAIVEKINWNDNPWFPEVLRDEMEALKIRDYQSYLTVWEGMCRKSIDGAIFANELVVAELENRITHVAYDPSKPVHRIWDLGWADNVAIWYLQFVGGETRLIRYQEDNQKTITHYLAEGQKWGYVYDTDWLPHDAQNKTLAANGKSIEEIVRATGAKTRIIPRTSIVDSINAARTVFGSCWFDRENTADGLQCLRHYQFEVDKDTGLFSKAPLHNWASHGADAFRMIGLMVAEPRKVKPQKTFTMPIGWMG
jgi:phage terminase large subunit